MDPIIYILKAWMGVFIKSMDVGIGIIKRGYIKPKDKLEKDWDTAEKAIYLGNYKALNAII